MTAPKMACVKRATCYVALAAILLLSAACGSPTPTPGATPVAGDLQALLRAGQAALDAGDLTAAEKSYREAAAVSPQSAEAQFGLGNALVRQNKLPEAAAAYQAAVTADPNMNSAQANLGVVYYQQGNLTKAADAFNAALRLKPDDPQTIYLLAAVRIQQNNLAEAEQLLNRARSLDPKLPEVYYGLGVLYKLKGQKADAIAAFQKFLEIGPGQDKSAADSARQELKDLQAQN